jgi:hypothetical protein
MRNWILVYLLWLILPFCLVATCSRPPVEPVDAQTDSLSLQHRLAHTLDSLDSLDACGAPRGCTCLDGRIDCPDNPPEAMP